MVPSGKWGLQCTAETAAHLARDPEFAFLVTLARAVNALKFGVHASREAAQYVDAPGYRQAIGSFFYNAGLLHEVLVFRANTKSRWGQHPVYIAVFEGLSEEKLGPEIGALLITIRNRAAFHLDVGVANKAVPELPVENWLFLRGEGPSPIDWNYEFSDVVAMAFLFGIQDRDIAATYARVVAFSPVLERLVEEFIRSADTELLVALTSKGFQVVEDPL